jgi:TonB-linked SusC/RagA family outer membrane protein
MEKSKTPLRLCLQWHSLKALLLLPLVLLAAFTSMAQPATTVVSGWVKNDSQEPIEAVSVEISNDSLYYTATSLTDAKGLFSFTGVKTGVAYNFKLSYVGYEAQTIKNHLVTSGTGNELQLVMKPANGGLQEVVVVGYGTAKRTNVTGAVDQIAGKKLAERPLANIFQGLQGVSPGLNITNNGGQPGQTPTINVRGFTSINGGGPLIVIDGIASATDDLLRINPADIASITVLRDAASAAIYGARASYGVLLVTTKEGTTGGRQSISYNNYFAWSKRTNMPEAVTDPYIYSRVLETSTDNTPWDYVNFSDTYYKWAKERSDNPTLPDTRIDPDDPTKWAYMGANNWNDYFFSKTNFSQYHSISLTGSADAGKKLPISYLLSADYTKENGLNKLVKDDWARHGLRGKLNFSPLKWLKIDNNLSVYQLKRDAPTYSITDVYYLQPTNVVKNPDGTWGNNAAGQLAAQLTDGGRNLQTRFGFQNISRAIATFFKGSLQVTGDASFKRELWKYHTEDLPYQLGYGPNDIRLQNAIGSISETNGTIEQDVFDLYVNYNKSFGNHAVKLLAGYNQESYVWSPVAASRTQVISSSVPYIGLTTGDATISSGTQGGYYAYAIRSWFGRVNYSFKDRYILEGNGRYDGSSRFPTNNRWGFFPSISAAWLANKEAFLDKLYPTLSTLKFRASYGDLGNQSVDYFGYVQALQTRLSNYLIDGNRNTVLGTAPSLQVDPANYTWEKVTTANIGADIGIFKDQLLASFDYYVRNTKGMLAPSMELPGVLGTLAPNQNSADLSTRGWELSLTYHNTFRVATKPMSFNARFILSDSKSKISNYNNALETFSGRYRPGQVVGEIWGLTNDGMFKSKEEIDKLDESDIIPWGALSIVEGWPKYKDLDGNGRIELGPTAKDPKDLSIIGNTSPRYRFGLNLDASWNNIDVSVFLQGVAKQDFYPRHYLFWGPYQQPYANVYPWNLDFYRAADDNAAQMAMHSQSYIAAGLANANPNSYFPVLQSWLADNNYGSGLDIAQTKYLLNAAYLRVKNLTIGYTLPAAFTKNMGLKRLRVFASGENLFEFSEIKKYIDPEAVSDGYGWQYPYQRKYSFGVNVDL